MSSDQRSVSLAQLSSVAALQPNTSINGTITTASTHSGGSNRTMRLPTTSTGGCRSIERAINDPPTANMTPIAGNTMLSQGQPTVW